MPSGATAQNCWNRESASACCPPVRAHRSWRNRCRVRWRTGAWAASRSVCRRPRGCQQRRRLYRDVGPAARRFAVVAARRDRGAMGWPGLPARAVRDRAGSGGADSRHPARSAGGAACGGGCCPLSRSGGGANRAVADATPARPHRKPAPGPGRRDVGRHHADVACRGPARAQRRADPLGGSLGRFHAARSRRPRPPGAGSHLAAPARAARGRAMVGGVGS